MDKLQKEAEHLRGYHSLIVFIIALSIYRPRRDVWMSHPHVPGVEPRLLSPDASVLPLSHLRM